MPKVLGKLSYIIFFRKTFSNSLVFPIAPFFIFFFSIQAAV
ncbi:hypothetical protein V6Z11_A13G113800 [Gossypium hirsutum]